MKTIDVKIEKVINNSYEIEIGYDLFDKLVDDITKGICCGQTFLGSFQS